MSRQKFCFSFNTYNQALEIIKICKNNNIIPILFVKSNLIEGLGLDWLRELRNMILNNYKKKDYKMYVDVRKNYGLFISLVEEKINFKEVGYIDFTKMRKIQPTVFSKYGNKIFGLIILLYIFLIFSFNRIKNE